MIMRRSQVSSPMEELRKDKRRSADSARPERTRSFVVLFIMFYASVDCEGLLLYFRFVFIYFIIKLFECSPVPASFLPYLRTLLQITLNIIKYIRIKYIPNFHKLIPNF